MFIILRLIFDSITISAAYAMAYSIRFQTFSVNNLVTIQFSQYHQYLIGLLMVYLLCFYFLGMYKTRKGFLIDLDELVDSFFAITLGWAIMIVLTFIRGEYEFSRPIIILSWPICFASIVIVREFILRLEMRARASGFGSKRAAIIGTSEIASSVARKIREHPSYGISFIGFIGRQGENVLGDVSNLAEIVKANNLRSLFVADPSLSRENLMELASFCDKEGLDLGTIPDVFQILTTTPSIEDIEGFPIVNLRQTRFTPLNRFIKRSFDLAFSFFGIIIFAIPMLLLIIFIWLFSPGGPAIYSQERVGRAGRKFNLYKFRTMIPDAEEKTGPVLATVNDPRKTLIGKILRSTNLDELPQLFNILKGDMSFVGPRPERPVFVDEFKLVIPKYMERHKIRPGLAGWAQLHGGYHMPAEEKIKYDLYYIENWSFLLDIKIILKYLQIAFTFQRRN